MKNKKCIICKKRYAGQQEWKTTREKELCFTCYMLDKFITDMLIELWKMAKSKGLDFKFSTELSPIEKKNRK